MKWMAMSVCLGMLALAGCSDTLEGNGDVVTETRTVASFDAVDADNGVQVTITVDPAVTGDASLAVTTDSNLQEYLTTETSGTTLTVDTTRTGGVTPTGEFHVTGTVAAITDISVDNGANLELVGVGAAATLTADNGAQLDGNGFEVTTATVNVDNGGQLSLCATGTVTGDVGNGASLTVRCGGSTSGVETSNGGSVSSTP